jgi:L-histidine Nalpha-methyltransferase
MSRAPTAIRPNLFEATRQSLQREPKELPPVWLYDERGSLLYEAITRLPDYYLPWREAEILAARTSSIAAQTKARTLVELGSGSARNTRFLLDALALDRFVPFDVSERMLLTSADAIAEAYPEISVEPILGNFERDLAALPTGARG